jgi:hypothetical protein
VELTKHVKTKKGNSLDRADLNKGLQLEGYELTMLEVKFKILIDYIAYQIFLEGGLFQGDGS